MGAHVAYNMDGEMARHLISAMSRRLWMERWAWSLIGAVDFLPIVYYRIEFVADFQL